MAEVQLNGELLYKGNDPISPTTDASTVYVTVNGQKIEIKTYIDNKIEEVYRTLVNDLWNKVESRVESVINNNINSTINDIISAVNSNINTTINSAINEALEQSKLEDYLTNNIELLVNNSVSEFIEADFDLDNDSLIKLFMTKLTLLEQLGQDIFISRSDAEETYLKKSDIKDQVTATVNDTLKTAFALDKDTTSDKISAAILDKVNTTADSKVMSTLKTAFALDNTTDIPNAIFYKVSTEVSNTVTTTVTTTVTNTLKPAFNLTSLLEFNLENIFDSIDTKVSNKLGSAFGNSNNWEDNLRTINNFIDGITSNTLTATIESKINTALSSGDSSLKNLIDARILEKAPSSTSSTGVSIDMLKNIKEELGLPRDLTTKIDTVVVLKVLSEITSNDNNSIKDAVSKVARTSVGLTNIPDSNGNIPKLNIAGDLITVTLVNPSEISQAEQPALP